MANDQSSRQPGTFNNIPTQFNRPFDAVRPDMPAENLFVANQGIKFMHYVAVPDPLYEVDAGNIRHSFDQEENQQFEDDNRFHRENGFIYFKKNIIYGIFQSNNKNDKYITAGLYTDAGAYITLNRYYADTEEKIEVSENDKLIPCELPSEFFTTIAHKFTHNPTGIDRLQFRAINVSHLIDSSGIVYVQGVDFNLDCGALRWINGANRPGLDPISGVGKVCAVRYTYKPYYYLSQIVHDIRIKPAIDPVTMEVTAKAGPILARAQADWVYLNRRTASASAFDATLAAGDGTNTGPR